MSDPLVARAAPPRKAEADGSEPWRPFRPQFNPDEPSLDRLVAAVAKGGKEQLAAIEQEVAWAKVQRPFPLKFITAVMILRDLLHQGWKVETSSGQIHVQPHALDGGATKEAVRRQLLFGRTDQLREPSVQRFIRGLESPSTGSPHSSISELIADGRRLAARLLPISRMPRSERAVALREECRPYLQLVEPEQRDAYTGLLLTDIWRYFRYTWSSRHRRSPGRLILYLIRDAAQPNHPVMGITALSNAVLQLTPRDEWLGWTSEGLLRLIACGELTDDEALATLRARVSSDLAALYTADLGFDGTRPPPFTADLSARLVAIQQDAARTRVTQLQESGAGSRVVDVMSDELLLEMTKTPLFCAKRAVAAITLLRAREALERARPPLWSAASSPDVAHALVIALRQVKQQFAARALMELTTCGAIPPYGHLLGGKLALLMMLSPSVRHEYRERYKDEPGVIASQMAGRRILKEQRLVVLGTTSLYCERSSQYNRLQLPAEIAGSREDLKLIEVGRSLGHGSMNLSVETERHLAQLARGRHDKKFDNVNFRFGEGQSPKMRQLREGLAALGLNAADLSRHSSPRIIYLAPLEPGCRRALLGVDPLQDTSEMLPDADERVAEFWRFRWLASRLDHQEALERVGASRPGDLLLSKELPKEVSPLQLSLFGGV